MLIRTAAIALALLAPTVALAQTPPPPREVVTRTAKAIEDLYFDPAKGAAIAADLRKEAAAGKYDSLTDPRDLATTLSDRLRPLDHHFGVSYRPAAPGPGPTASGPGGPGPGPRQPDADYEAALRRGNYGFKEARLLTGGVGYIQISQFADFEADNDAAKAAADAALAMVGNADALIIDLRDNGGGSPAMVGYLVSAFTPKNAPIYNVFHSRQGTDNETPPVWYATPRLEVPIYVLTSGRTGSAAEALPYTLQAAKRAVIVGEATGGAANPGGPAPLGDGYAVFISRGSPVNPITKSNWEGAGVQPDVKVPAAAALDTAQVLALEAILKTAKGPAANDSRWALEALKAGVAPPPYAKADYIGGYGEVAIAEENGKLVVKRGRRPAWAIAPLGKDAFYAEVDPTRRVIFERDPAGKVIAFEITTAMQPGGQRLRRD